MSKNSIQVKPFIQADHAPVLAWPQLDQEEENAVLEIIRDGNLSTHRVIRDLEDDYAQYFGRKYALAHNNGTSALMAAFHCLGLKPGDEVLVPTATFWASVLPMLWFGLVPVFCESESERLGIDPQDASERISDRTRAIVVVHLWGLPCKMTEIKELARKHDLKIIEDASHAHGATWRDIPCGRLGDVSVFSLQGDKLAPAGEGGILLTDDYEFYERAVCLGDITRIIELETPARRFAATSLGIKTRMAPMSAALARVQLKKLKRNNEQRNKILLSLSTELEKLGFDCFLPPDHIQRVYFEFLIRFRGVEPPQLLEKLEAYGCRVSRPRYPLLHQQPFFTEGTFEEIGRFPPGTKIPRTELSDLERTARENQRLIKLPTFTNEDNGIIGQYVEAFRRVLAEG